MDYALECFYQLDVLSDMYLFKSSKYHHTGEHSLKKFFFFALDDHVPPVISGCPSNIKMTVADHQVYEEVSWQEPTAEDESGSVTLVRQNHLPGTRFPAGVTSVLYVYADESQNVAKCTFQVHLGECASSHQDFYMDAAVHFVIFFCIIVDSTNAACRLHETHFCLL